MSLQTINHDVIAVILFYLEPKQALPLITACRSLHMPATQRLISEYNVTFSDSGDDCTSRLLKFCDYMLAYPQHRPPWLKALHIVTWTLAPPSLALTRLADLMSRATTLHKFTLHDHGGMFLEMNPSMMNAIANVDSLKCLTLEAVVSLAPVTLLSQMKSRPPIVTCLANFGDLCFSRAPPDPIARQFLHNITDCLKQVTLAGVLPIIADMGMRVVCPHVEALTLNDSAITAEQWEPIVRTFPNVRIFRTAAEVTPDFNASVPPCAEWSGLDMVRILSPLPLHHCHVRRVELGRPRGPIIHHRPWPKTLDMLRRISPIALTSCVEDKLLECVGKDLHCLKILRLVTGADGKHVLPNSAIGLVDHTVVGFLPSCTAHFQSDVWALFKHRIISTLTSSHLRALIIDLCGVPYDGDTAVLFHPHAEAIASAIRSVHLVGMRLDTGRNVKTQPYNVPWDHDHLSWNASRYQWYHVASRDSDGAPQLRVVAGEDVTRVVLKLLHAFQFPLQI
ncbi:hypothetical protein FOMPIDRAFT_89965 [Fomitopsis schrenkii]|uniref:F-box domain-containing protein n=1 Tax=Fomitopsis schrenkii TaxID=2126942 RepID=S8E3L3_FOMSC|nr:hypothetical protein FOMPIDRAFT_89965 [Fomitopsis schrenkii]